MDYTVDAVATAVRLLFLIARQPGLGVTELAKRSDSTKARAFRLLDTLEQDGLVQRELDSATYTLGYKALFLGAAAQGQLSLVRLAKRHLEEIGARCNENVLIRIRDGIESVCVVYWESTHDLRIHMQVGNRRPLHVGAAGKVLLAHAPQDVRDAVLDGELTRFTSSTITDPAILRTELELVEQQSYSVSFAECSDHIISVAAPVRDASGSVIAALGIAGPSNRVSKDHLQPYIDLVQDSARKLSLGLGHMG